MSTDKPILLVTGATGQLGREIRAVSEFYSDFHFEFFDKTSWPIEQEEIGNSIFSKFHPAFCINCAAYTAVDKAESDRENAYLINAEAVRILAATSRKFGSGLIHISTDYVFDGKSSVPLKEDDPVHPINVYGDSKQKGETFSMIENDQTLIIRTSWVYSEYGNNFVKTMIRLMKERAALNVVSDQVGSPTYAMDLARAILDIISSASFVPGIYHYSNEGRISWYDFAMVIRDITRSPCLINPILTEQYPTAARRPAFSLLDKTKIKEIYKLEIKDWRQSLIQCLDRLRKQEGVNPEWIIKM
jgi:dTDP-4-dehydrorhamnose reductase